MSRWRPLPDDLEPEMRLLVERLRALKDQSGLSLVSLANRTAHSKSSWERYLNGRKFPPQSAVRALCLAVRGDATLLDSLWSTANHAWAHGTPAPPPPTPTALPIPPVPVDATPALGETAAATEGGPGTNGGPGGRIRRPWWGWAAGVCAVVVTVAVAALAPFSARHNTRTAAPAVVPQGQLLLSPACEPVVSMGEHDTCVGELQRLLRKAGTTIAVDSDFGPETLRRLTAFQVLAGLPPSGIVNKQTATDLYADKVSMRTWNPKKVERLIRKIFTEAPVEAVAIARCQSYLDPLYVLPNSDGSRDWGVFQISDGRLKQFGGTFRKAFDPKWNVETAHRLWKMHHGFGDWPACEQAFLSASASPSNT